MTETHDLRNQWYDEPVQYETPMTEIEEVKAQIKVLEKKLSFLEEQEKEPEMLLMRQGKVDVVDYNKTTYYRIEYTDSFFGVVRWYERQKAFSNLWPIPNNGPLFEILEEYYQKEVIKQKQEYPYKVDETQKKSVYNIKDMEETIPKNHDGYDVVEYKTTPQTPEQVADGLKQAFREAVKRGVVSSDEDLKDDFMDEMVAELKGQTLCDVICDWWDEIFTNGNPSGQNIGSLVDTIEKWLPKEQSAKGSQNAYVECTVEGFNDAIKKIRGKLR